MSLQYLPTFNCLMSTHGFGKCELVWSTVIRELLFLHNEVTKFDSR